MSNNPHIIKDYVADYNYFRWFLNKQQEIKKFLEKHNVSINDEGCEGDIWEIFVDDIENCIEDLKDYDQDDIAIRIDDFKGLTYGDIVEFLEYWLKINKYGNISDLSKVYIEWF